MYAKTGDKAFFMFMAEMFHRDPDDELSLEEHTQLTGLMCVSHNETHRAFTAIRRAHGIEFDYINGSGNITQQIIVDPMEAAERAMAFLNLKHDCI